MKGVGPADDRSRAALRDDSGRRRYPPNGWRDKGETRAKEGEWAYMIKGRARITAVDQELRTFQEDVSEGEGWYFPAGIPHSIQGLEDDGCEFLLVFDDGDFDENSTFLLTEWLARTPKEVLAKNFNVPERAFDAFPRRSYTFSSQKYLDR